MLPSISKFYADTEELSRALDYTNVKAMQLSRGRFGAELRKFDLGKWSLQHIDFIQGSATCAGDGPSDRHAFVIPMRVFLGSRLLGRPVREGGIGVYAPGSEHADVTLPGHAQVVLVPPAEFAADRSLRAMQGLGRLLRQVQVLYTEVEYQQIYLNQPLACDLRRFLARHGLGPCRSSLSRTVTPEPDWCTRSSARHWPSGAISWSR